MHSKSLTCFFVIMLYYSALCQAQEVEISDLQGSGISLVAVD